MATKKMTLNELKSYIKKEATKLMKTKTLKEVSYGNALDTGRIWDTNYFLELGKFLTKNAEELFNEYVENKTESGDYDMEKNFDEEAMQFVFYRFINHLKTLPNNHHFNSEPDDDYPGQPQRPI